MPYYEYKDEDDYYRSLHNPLSKRRFYPSEKNKADIPGFPPGERKHTELAPEKPTTGPLDEFITPDIFDYENCAKCHAAPRNDAWNIYCKECGGRGLLSR